MSYQTYIDTMRDNAQTDMLAEFAGKNGKKQPLIDIDKELAKLNNKPLPEQLKLGDKL